MTQIIAASILIATVAGAIGVIVRARSGRVASVSRAVRMAAVIHHLIAATELVALVIVMVVPQSALGIPLNDEWAHTGLILSGMFTSLILLPCTVGLAAASFVRGRAARWVLIGVLWSLSTAVLLLQASALSNTWS